MLVLTVDEWTKIRKHIRKTYPMAVSTLSYVMKRELGFTPRYHSDYYIDKYGQKRWGEVVHIDFYVGEVFNDIESAEAFFTLRFLNREYNDD